MSNGGPIQPFGDSERPFADPGVLRRIKTIEARLVEMESSIIEIKSTLEEIQSDIEDNS